MAAHLAAAARLASKATCTGVIHAEACHRAPPLCASAEAIAAQVVPLWAAECERKQPSLWAVLIAVCRRKFWIGFIILFTRGCGTALFLPILIELIVQAFAESDTERATRLFAVMFAERALGAMLEVVGFCCLQAVATEWTGALQTVLVHKICHTPGIEGSAHAAGLNAQALIGREITVAHLKMGFMLAAVAQCLPFFIAGGFALVYLLGPAGSFGLFWVGITIRLNLHLMDRSKKAEEKVSVVAGNRMGITTNVISGMKAIKLFTWENEFLERLTGTRAEECRALKTRIAWQNSVVCVGKLTPITASLVTFLSFAFLGNQIRAGTLWIRQD
jgi:ABC-type multidrug transport system fused ATPase/permease subunit